MEKEFIPYNEALELKELGFDEPCIMQWTYAPELIFCTSAWGHPKLKTNKESYSDSGGDCISAPTYSAAFRWFREKYKLHIEIRSYTARFFTIVIQECKDIVKYIEYGGINLKFKTYEEAELACLRKLIELVKS